MAPSRYTEADGLKRIREMFSATHPVCICATQGNPKVERPVLPPTKRVKMGTTVLNICSRCRGTR